MPAAMTAKLVRLALGARATTVWRGIIAIAAAEPGWFLVVGVTLVGGVGAAVLRLDPRRQTLALGAVALLLTLLLTVGRRDARLHRIIGISPWLARVAEALLWSSPMIGVAMLLSLRDGAVVASVVAMTAALSVDTDQSRMSRGARRTIPGIPVSLPEWTVGLRRSAPILVMSLLGGIIGSGLPGVVVLTVATIGLTTSAYFWAPAEGWLLIHVRGQSANRFLVHKLLASLGLFSALVAPILLLGTLRGPHYGFVYLLTFGVCVHALLTSVLVKYASYEAGRPLDAAGSLVWIITASAIVVPPVGAVLALWLYRRAAARIAAYCPPSRLRYAT